MKNDEPCQKSIQIFYESLDEKIDLMRSGAIGQFMELSKLCDSPIERQLLAALMWIGPSIHVQDGYSSVVDNRASFRIVPQFSIGEYRVDFAIWNSGDAIISHSELKIAVECDGHDFHEKTKEQAARDKRRDRFLANIGWRVLRFTGSEIYKDARGCARQVAEVMQFLAKDKYRRSGKSDPI